MAARKLAGPKAKATANARAVLGEELGGLGVRGSWDGQARWHGDRVGEDDQDREPQSRRPAELGERFGLTTRIMNIANGRRLVDTPRRKYDSLKRATQALETRAEIARAARKLFVEQGWAATTVRDVAREAGVSVPTVYSVYVNKTGLALAVADAADLSADGPRMVEELESETSPARQLAAMIGYDRRLYERSGEVIVPLREAGRVDPELAGVHSEGRRRGDQTRRQVFSGWSDMRMDVETAIDVYAALCNIDVYLTLINERGWSPDRVEQWWNEVLTRELLLVDGQP
ncbi:TetR/AcrR family transcriptional regulator [Kibdelosporangium philippinense]|uniref:TetR/AcrR family transcriptional regulator n=1 Tax=Kibdelosporangium philippinense TaxID=211113 RepID=UPI0036229A6B